MVIPVVFAIDHYSEKERFLIKTLSWFLICCVLIYLFLIAGNYLRYNSWDGQLWYYKRVLLLKNDFFLDFTNSAHPPYLIELILAFIWRFISEKFVYTIFIFVTVINIFLVRQFYKNFGLSTHDNKFLSFIVFTSPIFMQMAFFEFKIDQFLLMFSILSLIIYQKLCNESNVLNTFLFGLFSGLAVLTKVSVAPFFLILFFLHLVSILKKPSYKEIFAYFVSPITFFLVILFWISKFGLGIPWTDINIYPKNKGPTISFERRDSIYKECVKEQKIIDFSQFIDDRNLIQIITQPINYIFNKNNRLSLSGVSEPGLYFYLSVLLFIPIVIKNRTKYRNNIFIATLIYTVYFYISIRTLYWYLFFLLPIYLIPFYECFFSSKKATKIRFLFIILGLTTAVVSVLLESSKINKKGKILIRNEYISKMMNNTEGLILDSSPFPLQVFLTYVDDYDKRIIRDSLYFGYTTKNDEDILKELKENNIHYVIYLDEGNSFNFYGCPKKHQDKIESFVEKYGNLYFADMTNKTLVYEIK